MGRDLAEAWGGWVGEHGPWHVFGALTYDQQRLRLDRHGSHCPPPADVNRAHVRSWLRQVDKATGHRLEAAVVALEYHKNGWPHFHPLLRLAGGLQGHEFADLGGIWFRDHGFAQLQEPRDQLDVATYAAKYVTKDLARGDVFFWPARGSWPPHQLAAPIGR